jgi:small subunit ribosomal protein S7
MSRKKSFIKRAVIPDSFFASEIVSKMINYAMYDGKKSKAEKIVYSALDRLAKTVNKQAINAFEEAIDNVKPVVEVKSRRIGGSTYQIPVEVRPERRVSLALKWLLSVSRKRKERDIVDRLSMELVDAYNKKGMAYKKKEDTHKMAEANKAFAHYRW